MAVKPLQNPLANSIHGKDARGKIQLLTKSAQGLRKGSKTGHRRVWGSQLVQLFSRDPPLLCSAHLVLVSLGERLRRAPLGCSSSGRAQEECRVSSEGPGAAGMDSGQMPQCQGQDPPTAVEGRPCSRRCPWERGCPEQGHHGS